ncbi:hypothetical protein L1887_11127 [Cichorium endivia]|nr:hypothetical protein L1887_11127 [Cichorium endivia]
MLIWKIATRNIKKGVEEIVGVEGVFYVFNDLMPGKWEGIVIAPHVAGHLLGGTVWKITKDGEDVIYAFKWNIFGIFVRPGVLITDAYNALNAILNTLRGNRNVLFPVDTAGRILELLLILEQYWEQHHLTYPIFFLTYVSSSTVDYVKSFLQWMSDAIAKSFERTRDNAFLLKFKTFGGRDPHRLAEDVAYSVARFFQKGGSVHNYYMVLFFTSS